MFYQGLSRHEHLSTGELNNFPFFSTNRANNLVSLELLLVELFRGTNPGVIVVLYGL